MNRAYQAGARKVVDFIEQNNDYIRFLTVEFREKWQTFLRELGVADDNKICSICGKSYPKESKDTVCQSCRRQMNKYVENPVQAENTRSNITRI